MEEKIIQFVKDNSYFTFVSNEDGELSFTTRAHGSIFDEEYGPEDYMAALELKKHLGQEFTEHKITIDTQASWVNIFVKPNN